MKADVCLFLEGTYPYVSGGVAGWTHDLILAQPHLKFYLVCIVPPQATLIKRYSIPSNVVGINHVFLQQLPIKSSSIDKEEHQKLLQKLEEPLLSLQHRASLEILKQILDILQDMKMVLGEDLLLNSMEAWKMIQRMYLSTMEESSFLNFFWSWRVLLSSFYSIVLAELPVASLYHSLSTGYAGLFLARARVETNRPCLVTEHGIYTNERRVEIASASWLKDEKAMNLNVEKSRFDRDLKDFWIDTFLGYSKMCYEASHEIITLYQNNAIIQIKEGADPNKIHIISNGVDVQRFANISNLKGHPPTIALVGRVVPIKDIKTYIRAVAILKKKIPHIQALILGSTDEDELYYKECIELVCKYQLEETVLFKGKIKLEDYFHLIDVIVLTSISEAQPLIILEAGAAGIPFVATDVGACAELIYGKSNEFPPLGAGGSICELANPESVAENILKLLSDKDLYEKSSKNIKERIAKYYDRKEFKRAYEEVYNRLISEK